MKLTVAVLMLVFSCLVHAQLTNESEVGIASANGNTKTQTFNFKQLNDFKWDDTNVASFKSRYLEAKAGDTQTAQFFMAGLRYEKQVSNHFGLFAGETLEKDKFAGIKQRLSSDLGGKYRFIESETTKLFSELGYRYMHEERRDDTKAFSNYGRVYSEWENKWNTSFSTKYWAEYLPNITDNKDWQFNTELSISAALTNIFALKTGALLRYDHFPAPGIVYKTDTLFTTALVAKF